MNNPSPTPTRANPIDIVGLLSFELSALNVTCKLLSACCCRAMVTAAPALVPVMITPEPDNKALPAVSETIEIEVGGDCRVRVGSSFDGRALKRVLDVLRKR